MKKNELTLLLRSVPIVDKAIKLFGRERRKHQDRQKIEKIEMDIKKIETKANTELQLIREKAISRIKIKELNLEELKIKYKMKYGVKP